MGPGAGAEDQGPGINFISKVTEHVAFRRIPHADISVSWSLTDYAKSTGEEKYSVIQSPDTVILRRLLDYYFIYSRNSEGSCCTNSSFTYSVSRFLTL